MEDLLTFAGWLLLEVVAINTGRAVVAIATLGRWRGEKIASGEARVYSLAGALTFKRGSQRVVTVTGLLLVGIIFYFSIAIGLIYIATSHS